MNTHKTPFEASAIIFNPAKNAVLLHKRDAHAPANPNKWGLFGGSGEGGESPEQALVREVQEELGVIFPMESLRPLTDYFHERFQKQRYVFVIECMFEKSAFTLGEGAGFEWVPVGDLLSYDLTDASRHDLELFLSGHGL